MPALEALLVARKAQQTTWTNERSKCSSKHDELPDPMVLVLLGIPSPATQHKPVRGGGRTAVHSLHAMSDLHDRARGGLTTHTHTPRRRAARSPRAPARATLGRDLAPDSPLRAAPQAADHERQQPCVNLVRRPRKIAPPANDAAPIVTICPCNRS